LYFNFVTENVGLNLSSILCNSLNFYPSNDKNKIVPSISPTEIKFSSPQKVIEYTYFFKSIWHICFFKAKEWTLTVLSRPPVTILLLFKLNPTQVIALEWASYAKTLSKLLSQTASCLSFDTVAKYSPHYENYIP